MVCEIDCKGYKTQSQRLGCSFCNNCGSTSPYLNVCLYCHKCYCPKHFHPEDHNCEGHQ